VIASPGCGTFGAHPNVAWGGVLTITVCVIGSLVSPLAVSVIDTVLAPWVG
jgi:hypothetical protein